MTDTKTKKRRQLLPWISRAAGFLLVTVSFLCFFAARWYASVYGQLGFDSVLYTLFSGLNGMDSGLILSFLGAVLPGTLVCSAVVCFVLLFRSRKKIVLTLFERLRLRLFPLHPLASAVAVLMVCGCLIHHAAADVELDEYLKNLASLSTIYEEEYRDPKTTQITFPEKKRNLIYIYLESMEISYMSTEENGALPYNTIPEMYALAQKNINFSPNEDVGGFESVTGTTWTIGAMVAQSSGVPLKTPPGIDGNGYGQDGNFLPGLTTIYDVLHENGYYQTIMMGSDAAFGGRLQYFSCHNMDVIYDIHSARACGIVPPDYQVWWGMEDMHLFAYAKQELTKIAAQDQPFAFTLLTVDTHHAGGYFCEKCTNTYDEQYENVFACSSRQVDEFVQWIQQQPFYENTTIVLVGDHPSMDYDYARRNIPEEYTRTMYNCFINAAAVPVRTTNRHFSTMDMFPTTLAAMGCTIEGDRLGLGINLFSETPTLLEVMGYTAFNDAVAATSQYYTKNFYFE